METLLTSKAGRVFPNSSNYSTSFIYEAHTHFLFYTLAPHDEPGFCSG